MRAKRRSSLKDKDRERRF